MNSHDSFQHLIEKIDVSEFKDKIKRTLFVGDSDNRRKFNKFSNNKIRSTKYSIVSWLPKSIIMQFRKVANIYFLVISILNFFYFSPKNPISMVITFGVVLMFTSIREGLEDYKRYKKDRKANEKKYVWYDDKNLETKGFEYKSSKKIHVGEIMKIFKDDELPADICLLKSSNRSGVCFIDRVNLDGESNLKDKKCHHIIQSMSDRDLCNISGILKCDKPNEQLDYWEGYMRILRQGREDIKISLDNDQLLLKGSYLKNTDYIIGIVIYTGHDTKIMQNARVPKNKHTKFMRTINKILYTVMIFQFCLCFVFAYYSLKWQKNHIKDYSYIIIRESSDFYAYIARVGTFLISYSQLIPISMYFCVEIIRLIQSPIIKYDKYIYDSDSKKPTLARTSELPDELGQVNYILSDKTGTITKNNMILEKISVKDQYFSKEELINFFGQKLKKRIPSVHSANISNKDVTDNEKIDFEISEEVSDVSQKNLVSTNVFDKNNHGKNLPNENDDKMRTIKNYEKEIIDFYRLCNICNSIVIDYSKNKNNTDFNYQSTSIDELALVKASISCGVVLHDKTINKIEINYFNNYFETWEILATLPFDSDRKRMSILVKSKLGEIYLFSKGADEVIFSKLKSSTSAQINIDCEESFDDIKFSQPKNIYDINCPNLTKAKEINEHFAKQGYRTLILGKKKISQEYFNSWFISYNNILNDINIPQAQKQNKMNDMFDLIEEGMSYVGCSAIEDKLQDGVEETIKLLKIADIKVWILTGDKIENSIEIAKSCNLIKNEKLVYFTLKNIKNFEEFKINSKNFQSEIDNYQNEKLEYCLILDGKTLSYYEMLDENYKKIFYKIMTQSTSAICCRLTPKQKSRIAKLLKNGVEKITLSVGDGANDVPMILEANIGIGISGMEGTQAVRSADYSISQFKFLRDLILYHGRLSYKRISHYTCYAFYKNIILVFTEIYFIIFNGFSGQIFFSDWLTNFYNIFWSSWPMVINYSMDKDIDRNLTLKYPFIYKAGPKSEYMNKKIFWSWIICAMLHGAVIFWIPMITNHYAVSIDGKTKDHWWTSSICFTILINIVTIKLFITTEYWNFISIIGVVSSLGCYYLCLYIFSIGVVSASGETKLPHFLFNMFNDYWNLLIIISLSFIALIPDFMHRYITKNFYLDDWEIINIIENSK